jgi:hypothetical protein
MPELTHAELCKIYQATGALARAAQLLGVGVTNEDGVVDFVVNDVPRSVEKLQADNSRLHRDLIAANNILLGKRAAIEERDKQIAANAGAAETMRLIEEHGLHIRRTSEGDKWFVLGGIHSMLGPDLAQCILWVGSMFAPPSSQSAATETKKCTECGKSFGEYDNPVSDLCSDCYVSDKCGGSAPTSGEGQAASDDDERNLEVGEVVECVDADHCTLEKGNRYTISAAEGLEERDQLVGVDGSKKLLYFSYRFRRVPAHSPAAAPAEQEQPDWRPDSLKGENRAAAPADSKSTPVPARPLTDLGTSCQAAPQRGREMAGNSSEPSDLKTQLKQVREQEDRGATPESDLDLLETFVATATPTGRINDWPQLKPLMRRIAQRLRTAQPSQESETKSPLTVQCDWCGRKFIHKMAHRCHGGFRRRGLAWSVLETPGGAPASPVDDSEPPRADWNGARYRLEYDTVDSYLENLRAHLSPQCTRLSTAAGVATQIDNYIAGLHENLDGFKVQLAEAKAENAALKAKLPPEGANEKRDRDHQAMNCLRSIGRQDVIAIRVEWIGVKTDSPRLDSTIWISSLDGRTVKNEPDLANAILSAFAAPQAQEAKE